MPRLFLHHIALADQAFTVSCREPFVVAGCICSHELRLASAYDSNGPDGAGYGSPGLACGVLGLPYAEPLPAGASLVLSVPGLPAHLLVATYSSARPELLFSAL